jgi:hypothetical protein
LTVDYRYQFSRSSDGTLRIQYARSPVVPAKPAKKSPSGSTVDANGKAHAPAGSSRGGQFVATSGGPGGIGSAVVAANPHDPAVNINKNRQRLSTTFEKHLAKALGGEWKTGYESHDVELPKPGGKGVHRIEMKSKHFADKKTLSVHKWASYRKAKDAELNKKDTFHTVLIDGRRDSEGGAHANSYSGHDMYYKRAAGAYSVSKMHKVKNIAELHKLLNMKDHELPEAARGEFLKGAALEATREAAEKDRDYNNNRSKARKEAMKAKGISIYA